jgi:hypothetical protein
MQITLKTWYSFVPSFSFNICPANPIPIHQIGVLPLYSIDGSAVAYLEGAIVPRPPLWLMGKFFEGLGLGLKTGGRADGPPCLDGSAAKNWRK